MINESHFERKSKISWFTIGYALKCLINKMNASTWILSLWESHLMLMRRKALICWKCFQAILNHQPWKLLLPWSTWIKVVCVGLNGNVFEKLCLRIYFGFIQHWYDSIFQTGMRNLFIPDSCFAECLIVAIWSNNTIWIVYYH